jgi:hypothetical protein
MDQFKGKGGVLGGREERYDGFEGEPSNIGDKLKSGVFGGHKKHDSHHANEHGQPRVEHGDHKSNPIHPHGDGLGADPELSSGNRSGHVGDLGAGAGSGIAGAGSGIAGAGSGIAGAGSTLGNTSHTQKKPGLMDKINPKIDSNGDGKAGFTK